MNTETLKDLPIFRNLDLDEIEIVVEAGRLVTFPSGTKILEEEKSTPNFYILCQGAVQLTKNIPVVGLQKMGMLNAGDYLGEISLISHYPQYLTAATTENSIFLEFNRDLFNQMLEEHRDIAYKLLRHLCHTQSSRLRNINDLLENIFTSSGIR